MSEHPRDRFDLIASAAAEQAFVDARARGRLHHAWLLCGPEGLGKATFAYRAARSLLGARPDPARGALGAAPNDPVSQLISAQSHPDLLVLERLTEGGRTKKSISVEQARDLPEFFSKSPSQAQHRVAIIDAADDLNINSANALLKVLEEPPERGVLFLVAHSPGRLLATIRSRCRRMTFSAWPDADVANLVARRTDLPADEAARIAVMARGSPGAALTLATAANLEIDRLTRAWVENPSVDAAEAISVTDGFRGTEGAARFEAVMDRLTAAVKAQAVKAGGQGAAWSELWSRLSDLPERAAAINLDRADVLVGALADLARVKARVGAGAAR